MLSKYSILNQIGTGGQGTVYKVQAKNEKVYALKEFKRKNICIQEYNILNKFNHDNIIQVYDYEYDQEKGYLLMEYINGCNLFDYMNIRDPLTEFEARYLFKQLIKSIKYIHENNYVHRDIKLENILIVNKKVKLIDFGLCVHIDIAKMDSNITGSSHYIAPEILQRIGGNYKSDIWSLGVVLYEMLCKTQPFVSDHIYDKNVFFHRKISKEAKHLIKMCLIHNEKYRISLQEILDHPWINNETKTYHKLWKKKEVYVHSKQTIECSFSKFILNI